MIYAAILAGGVGSRMQNGDLPKQFMEIGGKPILIHTIEAFLRCDAIDHIVVAVTKGWLDYAEDLTERYFGEDERLSVTVGGSDRLGSLVCACAALSAKFAVTEEDILLTHDGARPFVTAETIGENIALMADYDCVTTAVPAIDTILVSENGADVQAIPDRKTMFAVQTPQTFRVTELITAIDSLTEEEKSSLTDGAKIYLLKGKSVGIAKGGAENIKITEPKDIAIGEAILNQRT
ncbi:MAG: 2-C-methyl-D-erythritol 4-phosphate cytidylyltransferase [Firmicutes bacterium]|nr:2-C-methyl-D-erythritol 4-phosphate cytidylyltransferase [Bacillota bacterium]